MVVVNCLDVSTSRNIRTKVFKQTEIWYVCWCIPCYGYVPLYITHYDVRNMDCSASRVITYPFEVFQINLVFVSAFREHFASFV